MPALLGPFYSCLLEKIFDSFDIYCVIAGLCSLFFGMSGVFMGCIFFCFIFLPAL